MYQHFYRKTIHKLLLVLLLSVLISGQETSFFINYAHAAKAGQSCTKVGVKSGSFVCVKIKNKLVWLLIKRTQTISTSHPSKVSLATLTLTIDFSATSNLPVKASSLYPEICSMGGKVLQLKTIGYCTIRFTQLGNAQYLAAAPREIKILIQGSNETTFNVPTSIPLSSSTYSLSGTSTSGLSVGFESLTPDICSVNESTLNLFKVGWCKVIATQNGSDFYEAAQNVEAKIAIQGSNQISFAPITSLLLSNKTYLLSGSSTSGLPLKYSSSTLDTCSVSEYTLSLLKVGACNLVAAQGGSDLYLPALSIEVIISISGARVNSDQPDSIIGFQVKAIYVVPSDGVDHSYDTNGYITGILDEGNKYLRTQLGLQVPIDKNATSYDIQFLKSKLSTAYFLAEPSKLSGDLMLESMALESPGSNRKDYIFFIDVNSFSAGKFCGYAAMPGISAVVAIGPDCTGQSRNFGNWASATWPHELFHNFGVGHSLDDPCDFMRGYPETLGACPSGSSLTIDRERTRYIGSSSQGQDILKLPVWEGYTGKDSWSRCFLNPVPRADGFKYAYCPTGTQTIGALKYCWETFSSVVLEEFVDGAWKSLGAGSHYSDPWGPNVTWQCNSGYSAPWKQLTVTTPGISLYRWMRNGSESEQFKVIWVR